jgi:hypothetical protein
MRSPHVFARGLAVCCLLSATAALIHAQSWKNTAPESFTANAQITGETGGVATVVTIQINRYSADSDRDAVTKALTDGGHAAFVEALKKAPVVGSVKIGQRSVGIRWARQQAQGDGRHIALVTEGPLYFAGAGAVNAKPTEGFDVAVLDFTVDSVGLGKGTMATAAHVKAGGATGVQIDDYSGKKFDLLTVTRKIS